MQVMLKKKKQLSFHEIFLLLKKYYCKRGGLERKFFVDIIQEKWRRIELNGGLN